MDMERVDVSGTEADFIEFEFPDEATAERADKVAAFAAHTGALTRQVRAEEGRVADVREHLEAAGIPWTESESSVTEEDMWPEWPGDSDGDDETDDEEDETSPAP